jgi:acyl carrier protein
MQDQNLFKKVVVHIGEFIEADVSYLTPDSRLATSIAGMSSLKMFELLLYMEDCFGISFDESVIDKLDTMQDLVAYIRDRQSETAQPAQPA